MCLLVYVVCIAHADFQPVAQFWPPNHLTTFAVLFDQRRQPVDHPTEGHLSADSVEKLGSKM